MIWEERYSKTHQRTYYFNLETKQSVWEDPRPAASATTSTSSAAQPAEEPAAKKARVEMAQVLAAATAPAPVVSSSTSTAAAHHQTTAVDVVTTSYAPPVSGNARDLQEEADKIRILPFPSIIPTLPPSNEQMWVRRDIQVNPVLQQTYSDGFIIDREGVKQKFKDVTNPLQGRHIYNLVKENKFTYTLEIGFAMGASAVWICQAHRNNQSTGHHYAIDPNQTSQYKNIGKYLLEKSGLSEYLHVMEMTSYRALPKLYEDVLSGKIPKFDLIYIDGWHTFDYTLIDFFYADLLLNIHGVIVLDDIRHLPVRRCYDYLISNYKHYQIVEKTPVFDVRDMNASTQATFIKIAHDTRTWNAHEKF